MEIEGDLVRRGRVLLVYSLKLLVPKSELYATLSLCTVRAKIVTERARSFPVLKVLLADTSAQFTLSYPAAGAAGGFSFCATAQ